MSKQNGGSEFQFKSGFVRKASVVSMEADDKTLAATTKKWIKEAEEEKGKELLKKQTKNEKYWLGDQIDDKKLEGRSKIVVNKVFQNMETLVPIAAGSLPAPVATMPETENDSEEVNYHTYEDQLEEILLALAQENKVDKRLQQVARFTQLYYAGIVKFGYDEEAKEIWLEVKRPQRILVSPNGPNDYVIEYHEELLSEIKSMFPEGAEALDEYLKEQKKDMTEGEDAIFAYFEVTTPKMKFFVLEDVILKKIQNPHYTFDEEPMESEEDEGEEGAAHEAAEKQAKNHWKKPKVDYIFTDLWTLGKGAYSQTTLVEQTVKLQDGINKRKRQISDNADHANGLLIAYGNSGIDKKEAAAIERRRALPNQVIWLESAEPGSFQNFSGHALPPHVFDDMIHSISEMDNLWGTHSATRGEKTPGEETFGGRQLLTNADETRIGHIAGALETMAQEIYEAFAQLVKKHFVEAHYLSYLSPDGTSKQLKIESKLIQEGVQIRVRGGSSLRKDKSAESAEAIALWQNKAIDPITLHEKLGTGNPFKIARRLMMYTQDPQALLGEVGAAYENAIQSDEREKVLAGMVQADIENRALIAGKRVVPYSKATIHHVKVHQQLMKTEQFQQLAQQNPAVKKAFDDHLRAEIEIVKKATSEKAEIIEKENSKIRGSLDNTSR